LLRIASKVNEGNIGELSSNVRQLEEILAHKTEECTALQSALEGARELNAKLQSTSDNTTREIALHLEHITEKVEMDELVIWHFVIFRKLFLKISERRSRD
jgi:hypothetical protein